METSAGSPRSVALVSAFPPPVGGVTVHAHRLETRLESLGWRVVRIDTGAPDGGLEKVGTAVTVLVRVLAHRLRGVRIFHYHTSRSGLAFLATAPLLRLLGARTVLSVHSGEFLSWLQGGSLNARLVRRALSLLDLIVVMNEEQARRLRVILGPEPPVRSAPPFVLPGSFPDPAASRRAPDHTFRITTMGNWKPFYAYEEVLEAVEAALPSLAGFRVELDIVVSTASSVEEYRSRILEKCRQDRERIRLRVREDVSPDRVLGYLASRDLLVRSSRIDSYGLCVAEALFVGTPAIATRACRRPEGTMLYDAGDTAELTRLVVECFQRKATSSAPPTLDESEDAAIRISSWYSELLAGREPGGRKSR